MFGLTSNRLLPGSCASVGRAALPTDASSTGARCLCAWESSIEQSRAEQHRAEYRRVESRKNENHYYTNYDYAMLTVCCCTARARVHVYGEMRVFQLTIYGFALVRSAIKHLRHSDFCFSKVVIRCFSCFISSSSFTSGALITFLARLPNLRVEIVASKFSADGEQVIINDVRELPPTASYKATQNDD